MGELTDLERELLDFAGLMWRSAGLREQAIRDRFDLSATRYHQLLHGLIRRPEALAFSISHTVTADDNATLDSIVAMSMGTLRTAFHALGAGTPNWPANGDDAIDRGVSISLIESTQRVLLAA